MHAGGVLFAIVATAVSASATSTGVGDGNEPPAFDHPTTPVCGETVFANIGQPVSITVQASDVTPNDVVTLSATGVPGGATLTPRLPAQGNPVSTLFEWTPTSPGQYEVTFTATDLLGHFTNCSFPLEVGVPPPEAFCFGDGPGDVSGAACPCGNNGSPGNGCANSDHAGGANLSASGNASLSADTLVLTVTDQHAGYLQLFIQSDSEKVTTAFGDGLRCITGNVKRMFRIVGAHATTVSAPSAISIPPAPATISGQSADRGDQLSSGHRRGYQVYYRDNNPTFCPVPTGSTFNVTNAIRVVWGP